MQEEKSEQYEEYLSCVTICLTVIWHASLRDVCVESMIARVSPQLGREYPPREWSGIGQFPDVTVDTISEKSWE